MAADYFGGVLASSRTEVGRDDRGAAFVALLGRLSTYQIRSHYFFYSLIRIVYEGLKENIGVAEGRLRLTTFIPVTAYIVAMEFGKRENVPAIMSHVMFGLSREALIEDQFMFGGGRAKQEVFGGIRARYCVRAVRSWSGTFSLGSWTGGSPDQRYPQSCCSLYVRRTNNEWTRNSQHCVS